MCQHVQEAGVGGCFNATVDLAAKKLALSLHARQSIPILKSTEEAGYDVAFDREYLE